MMQKAVLGYETPAGKRSYEMGTIVQNVATINAIANADWPVVQGLLLIQAFLVVFSNLLSDILYAVVDPRIQYA